jgi:hypothetical protein
MLSRITDETDTGRRRTDAAGAPEPIDVETPERLRDELVGGLLYCHDRENTNTTRTLEVSAFSYALIELLLEKGPLQRHFVRDSLAATEGLPTAGGDTHLRRQTDALPPLIPATRERLQSKCHCRACCRTRR